MSDVELNETINGYRGSIGKLVFKKYKGRTIVGRKVKSSKPPTEGQLAHQADFKDASAFAKSVQANPALLAFYGPIAKQRDVTVRVVAMGDYMKKPVIKPLDLSGYKGRVGDVIKIRAIDDLGFANLQVEITARMVPTSKAARRSRKASARASGSTPPRRRSLSAPAFSSK